MSAFASCPRCHKLTPLRAVSRGGNPGEPDGRIETVYGPHSCSMDGAVVPADSVIAADSTTARTVRQLDINGQVIDTMQTEAELNGWTQGRKPKHQPEPGAQAPALFDIGPAVRDPRQSALL